MSSSLFSTLNISRQDMLTRLLDLDIVGDNLANVNTAGFKSSRTNFQELLAKAQKEGIYLPATQALMGQGTLRTSENSMDWAIEGEGFFQVRLPDGRTAYTRDGQFNLDGNRRLVNSSGYPLIWSGQIPADIASVSIQPDGTVTGTLQDGTAATLGKVQLARFANPSGLFGNGNNVWLATASSGAAQTGAPGSTNFGVTRANSVEQSNVDLAGQMTQLMTDQRTFQMSVKAFQQTDVMIQQAINLRKA
jgi:flagellar basal-body rod protein FlgG